MSWAFWTTFSHYFMSKYIETQAGIFGSCHQDSAKNAHPPCRKWAAYLRNVKSNLVLKFHCIKQTLSFHSCWLQPTQRNSFSEILNLWESYSGARLHSNSSSMCKIYLVLARNGFNYVKSSELEESGWRCSTKSQRLWMLPALSPVSVYFCSP